MMFRCCLTALLVVVTAQANARAHQVSITLPLGDFLRPGRATILSVRADGLAGQRLKLRGEGLVPLELPIVAGRVECLLPLYFSQPPERIDWTDGQSTGSVPLHTQRLAPGERLAISGSSIPDLALSGPAIVASSPTHVAVVDLQRSKPLCPAAAFVSADVILLDPTEAARVDESQLSVLVSSGVAVAIRSSGRPASAWPWKQDGAWWVLSHPPDGPAGPNADVYLPTYSWERTWPRAQGWGVLASAGFGCVVLCGLALLRGKTAAIAAIAVCCTAGVTATVYVSRLSPVARASGTVIRLADALEQRDDFEYLYARQSTRTAIDAGGAVIPLPAFQGQAQTANLSLSCTVDGEPDFFELTLAARQTMAFVRRTARPASGTPAPPGDLSAIMPLAERLYRGVARPVSIPPVATASEDFLGAAEVSDRVETPSSRPNR